MQKSMVYTRRGDEGMTSLVGGARVRKDDIRLEAYGTIDELNSFVGMLIAQLPSDTDRQTLTTIQHRLFSVGGYLATDRARSELKAACRVSENDIAMIERRIDAIDDQLPAMTAFILPGGTVAASTAHVCRTVCRRAERCILTLSSQSPIDPLVLGYVNRLSDYFFVLARKLCFEQLGEEIIWSKNFE